VFSLLRSASGSRRSPSSVIARVARDREWAPFDITTVRKILDNEATTNNEIAAPNAEPDHQVKPFAQRIRELQHTDGTAGQCSLGLTADTDPHDFNLDDYIHKDAFHEDANPDDQHDEIVHNTEHDQHYSGPPDDQPVVIHSVTRRKRKQGGRDMSYKLRTTDKRARIGSGPKRAEEELSSREEEAGHHQERHDVHTDEADGQSDGGSSYYDADQRIAGADTDSSVESIEQGRNSDAHAALDDHPSDTGWSPADDAQKQLHDVEDSPSFQLAYNEAQQFSLNPGPITPRSKTPPLQGLDLQTPPRTETSEQDDKTRRVQTPPSANSKQHSTSTSAAADAGAINVSATTQRHILDQLAPLQLLGDTTMETILPFWLLPKSDHLALRTPPTWLSFRLPRHWRTTVSNTRDIFVNLFRPTRSHWILMRIEVDKACVSVFDPLRAPDPDLEVAAKAIVAAMDHDWQEGKWSFDPVQCPQQDNGYDCGVFVILYVIHLAANIPLSSVAILDGGLWRTFFALLVRRSPLTAREKASLLTIDTAAPAASKDLSACEKLVLQHEQVSAKIKILQSKQNSFDHAKRLLTSLSQLFGSLVTDTTAPTSHLADNQQFLDSVLARNCPDDRALIEILEEGNMRIEAELHSSRVHTAKVSDLAFLLEQVEVLSVACTELQTRSGGEATRLVYAMRFEQAVLSARLEEVDAL
jgi:hypothetical protein